MSNSSNSLSTTSVSSEISFILPKTNENILKNFGIDESIFNLRNTPIHLFKPFPLRKNFSKRNGQNSFSTMNALVSKENLEIENIELYQENDEEYLPESVDEKANRFLNTETNFFNDYEKSERQIIKAYKSKHKSKFYQIYQHNSQQTRSIHQYKMFHKCNFPHCNRTFSSSGWLKAHFDEHLKEMNNAPFNILFDLYIKQQSH